MIVSAKVVSAQTEYENNNCALQTRYVTDVIVSRIAFKTPQAFERVCYCLLVVKLLPYLYQPYVKREVQFDRLCLSPVQAYSFFSN